MTCWHCNGLGAVRRLHTPTGRLVWVAFRPEPQGNIRLDRDEHPCPACGGDDESPPTELEQQIREREQRQRAVEVTL